MGILKNDCEFLVYIHRHMNVSFEFTLTLGRQSLFLPPRQLEKVMEDLGVHTRGGSFRFLDELLKLLGSGRVDSLDYSDYEGADIVHNLDEPIPEKYEERYTCLIDAGTLEHVFDFPRAIWNCMKALRTGGHFVGITPANNYVGHGFYQFSPELFYRIFSKQNGFKVLKMWIKPGDNWYEVPDPDEVGARVELINSQRTLLYIVAVKTHTVGKLQAALQSDYRLKHDNHTGDEMPSESSQRSIKNLVPAKLRGFTYNALALLFPRRMLFRHEGLMDAGHFKKTKLLL